MEFTHMKRPPRQQRSIASTNLMLDAAEALFAEGGANAVTVEAVVRQSGTSVGAFYARFIDRSGLLSAMQDRFHVRMMNETATAVAAASTQPSLKHALNTFVKCALPVARKYRESILFFVATSATDTPLRRQGVAENPNFAAAFSTLLQPFRKEIGHKDPDLAIDIAFRIFFALFIQHTLFGVKETTGRDLDEDQFIEEISQCLYLYLSIVSQ
jgi:AcrR family transcriptional regulator